MPASWIDGGEEMRIETFLGWPTCLLMALMRETLVDGRLEGIGRFNLPVRAKVLILTLKYVDVDIKRMFVPLDELFFDPTVDDKNPSAENTTPS